MAEPNSTPTAGQLSAQQPVKPVPQRQQLQVSARFSQYFEGPLPPPEYLERYDKIVPGGAERILRMAEKEQAHRHAIEKTLPGLAMRGQVFGFILGFVGIVGGIVLVAMGKSIAGLSVFISSLGSLLAVYMYGMRSESPPQEQTKSAASGPKKNG